MAVHRLTNAAAARQLAGLALALVCVMPAHAVMAPEVYEEGRRTAANHVQIRVTHVRPPEGGMGDCAVTGEVMQVFRGDLGAGDVIKFDVSCYAYGELPDSGTLWTDVDALRKARFLEAFMSSGPNPHVVLDQIEIIVAPRDRPYCDTDSLACESTFDHTPVEEPCSTWEEVLSWIWLSERDC